MVKALLGVRKSTPKDICLTELGLPTVSGRIRATQKRFYTRLITDRSGMRDDPFFHVWTLCKETKTKGYRCIKALLDGPDPLTQRMT